MTEDILKSAQEAFAAVLIGYNTDAGAPITRSEASALRDRHKSLMNTLAGLQEHIGKLDQQVQALKSHVYDTDEIARQHRSLAARVTDMSVNMKDLLARLRVVEEKLGVVSFNEMPTIIEEKKKPRTKKK